MNIKTLLAEVDFLNMTAYPFADENSPELGGNDFAVINNCALCLIGGLTAAVVLGFAIDYFLRSQASLKDFCKIWVVQGRPPPWVIILLIVSYGLLVPGLAMTLFSFNVVVSVFGFKMAIGPDGGSTTETMVGLIALLWKTGSHIGALVVIVYAMLIPALKLGLMLVGEGSRNKCPPIANRCIQIVQNLSKWACPDMFAYIFLVHLVRGFNHPQGSEFLQASARLDVGFTCFSLFCLGSTFASLGIQAPDRETSGGCGSFLAKRLIKHGVLFEFMTIFGLCFFVLLFCGVQMPVMALRINDSALYKPVGSIDPSMKMFVDALNIEGLAKADVSCLSSISRLWSFLQWGEINSAIALVMVTVFALACTAVNVGVLICSAYILGQCKNEPTDSESYLQNFMLISWVLKKLSMLDVLLMGVVVVTLCASIYKKAGVVISCHGGLIILAAAEAIHYIMYYTVKGAAERVLSKAPQDAKPEAYRTVKGHSDNEEIEAECEQPAEERA